jgi:hypothetical protein|tara:strand:+ start:410 stop:568 length:159 start_codon:yes stop_codon:yes gene_type:complete
MDSMTSGQYNNHYDCATAGYINALGLTREIGPAEVERSRITIKFECKPIDSV